MASAATHALMALLAAAGLAGAAPARAEIEVTRASALDLPATPRALVTGDVDGDGRPEIVALLVWPVRSSVADQTPLREGVVEVRVRPAIEERRELWVVHVDESGRMERRAAALPVGRELLGLESAGALGPVIALCDAGPARVALAPPPRSANETSGNDEGAEPATAGEGAAVRAAEAAAAPVITLELIAELPPLFAGADFFLSGYPLARDLDGDGVSEFLVPVDEGLAIVRADGSHVVAESALVETNFAGRSVALPRVVDVDGDGLLDLLEVAGVFDTWSSAAAVLRRGLGDLRFAAPERWDLDPLLEVSAAEREDERERLLWDVSDADADGTLEAIVSLTTREADSIGDAFDLIRGGRRVVSLHPLLPGGALGEEAERELELEAHPWPYRHRGGWRSPFADLDGEPGAELLTLRLAFGAFGATRAVTTGTVRSTITPSLYRLDDKGIEQVRGAIGTVKIELDLREGGIERFRSFDHDIDADGRLDMVDVDGERVALTLQREGPRFPEEPDLRLELSARLASVSSLRFVELDGGGLADVLAIEELEADEDATVRPARLELFLVGAEDAP